MSENESVGNVFSVGVASVFCPGFRRSYFVVEHRENMILVDPLIRPVNCEFHEKKK